MDCDLSAKDVNSAKRMRVRVVMEMGQGHNKLPCTSRTMTDVTIVPPILMTGLRSASYIRPKEVTALLLELALEKETLSQRGENTFHD